MNSTHAPAAVSGRARELDLLMENGDFFRRRVCGLGETAVRSWLERSGKMRFSIAVAGTPAPRPGSRR
jgi:hypothetical protein